MENSGQIAVQSVIEKIEKDAFNLKRDSKVFHSKHQILTVATILLGVCAPAVVTYTASPELATIWKIIAILITAIATASATIRSVLRYNQRYSNSELTSLSLSHLQRQVQAQMYDVLTTVQELYRDQKLYKIAGWADEEMYKIMKNYIDKEVAAMTQEQIKLTEPPKIEDSHRIDPTKIQ